MPKGYYLSEVNVTNPTAYEAYRTSVLPTVQKFGGRFLVRGGEPKAIEGGGFGSRVIEGVIGQLKGKACFDWRPEGLVCEISLQA